MNYGRFTDVEMDQLLTEFMQADDRAAAAQALYYYFEETAPIAPICFRNYTVVTHREVVENLVTMPDHTFSAFEQWTIHLAQ